MATANETDKARKYYEENEEQIEKENKEIKENKKKEKAEKNSIANQKFGISKKNKKKGSELIEEMKEEKNTDTDADAAAKNYIENSNEAIANANVGDYIKRKDGTEVQLTQGDIDYAKAAISPKVDEEVVEEDAPNLQVGTLSQEQVDSLLNSGADETEVAKQAIETGDPSPLGTIVDPETGEPVIQVEFTKDGTSIIQPIPENKELFSQGTAIALTLVSVALSALTGGAFPPVNFMNIRWNEAGNIAIAAKNKAIAQLNEQIAVWNDKVMGKEATEMNLQSAKDNPDLYSRENTDALARAKAAESGNVALEQTEMNADLQKALTDMNINWNREALNLTNEQQIKLSKLLYEQEVRKVFDTIKTMEDNGKTPDEIAKYISGMNGTTTLARGLGYAKDITGMANDLVGAVSTGVQTVVNPAGILSDGKSSKDVKKFRDANTNLLRKNKLW